MPALLLLLPLLWAGCSRPAPSMERVAVLPFENLSPDRSLDWIGSALQGILVSQTTGSKTIYAQPVKSDGEAHRVRASRLIQGYFSAENGRLRVNMAVRGVDSNQTLKTAAAQGPLNAGILPLADRLAGELDPQRRRFGTGEPSAVRHFAEGLLATDIKAALAACERATEADPAFGEAYVRRAQLLIAAGDRQAAGIVIEQAGLQKEIAEIEKAQLAVLAAMLDGRAGARKSALEALAPLVPGDTNILIELAQAELQARRYQASVEWYRKAAQAETANPGLWNQLAYAHAYAGDLKGAQESLQQYEKLAPGDANVSDSTGEVHFYLGRFPEAEKAFLESHARSPKFLGGAALLKAAQARLMTGDEAGAGELFKRYAEARRSDKDPLVDYRAAQWDYLTGRRKDAVSRLTALAVNQEVPGEVAAIAHAELSIWALEAGDTEAARRHSALAFSLANGPQVKALAATCRFLAQPQASASEWAVRAERTFPGPALNVFRKTALAYALLFAREFREASLLLKEVYAATNPASAGELKVLLAWSLIESGQTKEALEHLRTYPIPRSSSEPTFTSLVFPRIFYLRGVMLEQEGDGAAAKEEYRKFLALAGEGKSVFDDRKKAREMLAAK